jgi:cytochrome P450 / NADPH-cytochrome P450 reductase
VLFFGCQHPDWDDLYASEFAEHVEAGRLEVHRAFSRTSDGDIRYVQHRLWDQRKHVHALIGNGAHVYVCGDATGMGLAVEETLRRIGATVSDDQDGRRWLETMREEGRYATDVY